MENTHDSMQHPLKNSRQETPRLTPLTSKPDAPPKPPTAEGVGGRRLIVMTRVPEVGRVKTRLIPALGPDGAATLHTALLRETLRMATRHARQAAVEVEVRFTGGPIASRDSLAPDQTTIWREQQGANLGDRMHGAVATALSEGASAVMVIGTDCPDLSAEILSGAWRTLDRHDVVLGPAEDGGYYLIALKRPAAGLFQDVDWGTGRVLRQTRDRCRRMGMSYALLPTLSDVDEPEDLIHCRRLEGVFPGCLPPRRAGLLSVVVPTLNEVDRLETTLSPLRTHSGCEVIVADGGSTDGTPDRARELGCRVVVSKRGRGRQLNAGASLAAGDQLLFLHADTRLPPTFREEIASILEAGAIAGAFRLEIDHPGWSLRCVEWGTNLRSRWLQRPYGDQGLFMNSADFFRLGGFRNWPLMEDFELCGRLRRHGRIRIAPSAVETSGRRWLKLGAVRTTFINQLCIIGFRLGVSPERLARWYSFFARRGVVGASATRDRGVDGSR